MDDAGPLYGVVKTVLLLLLLHVLELQQCGCFLALLLLAHVRGISLFISFPPCNFTCLTIFLQKLGIWLQLMHKVLVTEWAKMFVFGQWKPCQWHRSEREWEKYSEKAVAIVTEGERRHDRWDVWALAYTEFERIYTKLLPRLMGLSGTVCVKANHAERNSPQLTGM